MHPLIETYLVRVETRLEKLSPNEREQQLQEISLHLQSLVAYNQSQGLSEADAIYAALSQFGEPVEIGSGIEQQVLIGHRPSVIQGLVVGAIAGMSVLVFPNLLSLLLHEYIGWGHGFGGLAEMYIEAAAAGAVASLVGRNFTWRYLSRPARVWPLFAAFSQIGTVTMRMMGVGLLRGAVGGVIFGYINTIPALLDPHCTLTSIQEMLGSLAFWSFFACFTTSVLTGFFAAIIGAVRRAFGRTPHQIDLKKIRA